MIERLIENWLVNCGERGYETAFAQLLGIEEHRVIQGPVHHPYEHGKDIYTFASDGQLHGYQLKGPDLVKLEDFEKIVGQLTALVSTAITHPAVSPPRRPDRAFLVTNAVMRPEVRDRIEKFNLGNPAWAPVEPIEREQLLGRFVTAHGSFLPQNLPELRTLIDLYYSDPNDLFPVKTFARYLDNVLPFPPATPKLPECRRALSSAALLTAYATASWVKAESHFCVAQGWLTACCAILRFAAVHQLHPREWKTTYTLARDAARAALAALTKEAAESPDLVIPDVAEGMVYPYRALLVCGCLGAYFLSERTLTEDVDRTTVERIRAVLTRELQYGRIAGECDVPGFLMWSAALEQLGEIQSGEAMSLTLVQGLAARNQPNSKTAFPDPYHPTEDVLLHQSGAETPLDNERFDGRAYTLHASIEWVARRLWRNFLKGIWADITHITFHELRPSDPTRYLAAEDPDGVFTTSFPGQPESWGALLARSRGLDRGELPNILWEHREMVPYVALLFPYRFTPTLAKAIDLIAHDPKE